MVPCRRNTNRLKGTPKRSGKVAGWVEGLSDDAAFNFESYADCFVSENLVRKYIKKRESDIVHGGEDAIITQWKEKEKANKGKGNISIEIRSGTYGFELPVQGRPSLLWLIREDPTGRKPVCPETPTNTSRSGMR